jgi:hypothetical protein
LTPLGLLAGLLVLGALGYTVRAHRGRPPGEPPRLPPSVGPLCATLTGAPQHDQPILNRILALGPGVIPELIEVIADRRVEPDPQDIRVLAEVEALLADFGLAAVGPVAERLSRLPPAVPLTASLTRVVRHIGQPGLQAFVNQTLSAPNLGPFLPQIARAMTSPTATFVAALTQRPGIYRRRDLDTIALVVPLLPTLLDDLWRASAPQGQAALLDWLADWRCWATEAHLAQAQASPDAPVRAAGAHLARLLHPTPPPAPTPTGDLSTHLAALEAPQLAARQAAIAQLEAHHIDHDPRVRERLIRLADGPNQPDRLDAIVALARHRNTSAPALIDQALQQAPSPEALLRIQEAALLVGPSLVPLLARRMRALPHRDAAVYLATLRVLPGHEAVAPLLRGLEDARSGAQAAALAATLAAGGAESRAAINEALETPARGLLPPALRYQAIFATADDLPQLLRLFDRHQPMRSIVLNIIESLGPVAQTALRAHLTTEAHPELARSLAILQATEPSE